MTATMEPIAIAGGSGERRPPAVVTKSIAKSFGDKHVLDGVSIEIPAGTVYALLGPNGAGKTTLIRILATLLPATSGTAIVAGADVRADAAVVRSRIGLAGQFAAVDGHLSGRENLIMVAELYNVPRREARARADAVLARIDLTEAADQLVRTYSGGMRRRLDLAASMVGRPPVLFLDEPTTGVDPRARVDIWELINELVSDGTTLLLTTQYLDEAEQLADTIGVIMDGRLVAEGTAKQLKERLGGDRIELSVTDAFDQAVAALEPLGQHLVLDRRRGSMSLPAPAGARDLVEVLARLDAAGISPASIGLQQPSLDDVFLTLTASTAGAQQ